MFDMYRQMQIRRDFLIIGRMFLEKRCFSVDIFKHHIIKQQEYKYG